MASNSSGGTFIGFAGILFAAAILCSPVLGFGGIIAAVCTIYFGLVFTNGAATGARNNSRKRR